MATNGICRLCLEHAEDLLEIFHNEGTDVLRIDDILTHYSIIEIEPNDCISNKICLGCWSKIHDFHEFCLRIQKIQDSISSIFYSDSKNDINEVVLSSTNSGDEFKEDFSLIHVKNEEQVVEIVETSYANVDLAQEATISVDKVATESSMIQCATPIRGRPKRHHSDVENKDCRSLPTRQTIELKRGRKKMVLDEKADEVLINSFYSLNCELCQEHFSCCKDLFNHYEVSHKIRGFITCCGKKYMKTAKISEHIQWHKDPDLFKCSQCDLDKVFPDKKHLEAHMVTHIDDSSNVFHCEYCDKTFTKKYRFEQHKLTHLRPDEKKHICRECGKPYATESLLRVHVRVVHIKSYARMCEICAKVFKSRVFFEKHQLEHMGKTLPKVQCQICNAWMKNEHTMRAHMRLHEDEGMVHECDLCGKTGPSRNAILKHKRYVHFSERKFKCTLCEKAFKRALSLKEHMSLHTGEVLYKCTYCAKTFNSGANMFSHKKKMHHSEWKIERERDHCEN